MVTVITNKLKKQSLEDLPNEPLRITTNTERKKELMLQADSQDRGFIFRVGNERRSGLGHLRTRSYPTHDFRGSDGRGGIIFDSCISSTSSTVMPPASKRLCRSISVPLEESSEETGLRSWVPKASKVWQPVKGFPRIATRSRSASSPPEKLYNTNTTTRSARAETELLTSPAVNFISTPPASPTPRPASAFAALSDNQICMKGNIKEESITPHKNAADASDACPRLHRSRSQPCFERARTCGIKRRIEDDFDVGNKLRPALDLAKMEESSYFRFRDKKRGLRIPRCSNKREAKESPAPYFTEHENFILKPIISSPLDAKVSSIMITPTSSPTKQLDLGEKLTIGKLKDFTNKKEKALERKIADEGVYHLDYDSELDIASIEGDDF